MPGISEDPTSQLDDPLPAFGADDPAMRMMLQDMRSYLPDDILCKVDRAAMGVSLETRTPFLDPEVIALSTRLPMAMKIREGQGKWALRQVLYQHVPREMIERPKAGFAIPIGIWLRGPLRDWAEELLSHERLAKDGFFDPDIVRQHMGRAPVGTSGLDGTALGHFNVSGMARTVGMKGPPSCPFQVLSFGRIKQAAHPAVPPLA